MTLKTAALRLHLNAPKSESVSGDKIAISFISGSLHRNDLVRESKGTFDRNFALKNEYV